LGGIKVSSVQIESVLNKLDFIKESAAIAVEPKGGGPSLLVVFYVENVSELTDEEKLFQVKKSIGKQLNPLFKVSDLVKINVLPRTASNKVMRRKLRENYMLSSG
jgi:acetyl-CoA synthetase